MNTVEITLPPLRDRRDDISLLAMHFLRVHTRRYRKLLEQSAERLLGRRSVDLGLEECLGADTPRVMDLAFPGGAGRWDIRRSTFREGGLPHQLLVLSDLTRSLRDEERQAWQRLIKALRHEINNSLAPIDSLAGTLATLLTREPRPDDWEAAMGEGLGVIRDRSKALNRFMTAYTRLRTLPKPKLSMVTVGEWVLTNTENLFVPFFTTRPDGAGIGLALSRQIAEAHGGQLTLQNREDSTGCLARLRLPVRAGTS